MVKQTDQIKVEVKLRTDGWAWSLHLRKGVTYSWRFITGGNCDSRLEAYGNADREFNLAKKDAGQDD